MLIIQNAIICQEKFIIMDTLGKRIKTIRKSLKLKQLDFAIKLGLESATAVSKYEDDSRTPDKDKLIKISNMGNITLDKLLTGVESPVGQTADKAQGNKITYDDNFVTIPHFSDKISAGGGLVPINDVDIKVAFKRDWIQRKGNPEKMSLIAVSGDSMEPTLMPRDIVLVNHDHNHLDPQGGIYAIALYDIILIKRLQVLYPSGKVRIISDNSKYASFELSLDEIKINGKVIWFGREI